MPLSNVPPPRRIHLVTVKVSTKNRKRTLRKRLWRRVKRTIHFRRHRKH